MSHTRRMTGIWYEEFGSTPVVRELDVPKIHQDAVLIKVRATGICRSDWHGWMGHDADIVLPHIPGHEFAGDIVEVGSGVKYWKEGTRVTSPFIQACGTCYYCQAHNEQVCMDQQQAGFTSWGSFAEYVEVRYADINLVCIPENISYEEAAILGCRFGTAFRAIVDQAKMMSGQWLAIFGCGGVGLASVMIAKALGVKTISFDPNFEALELARELGTMAGFSGVQAEAMEFIRANTVDGVDVSIDAVGSPKIISHGLEILGRRGQHIQVGLLAERTDSSSFPLSKLIARELEIKGSHGIQAARYAAMLNFIERKKIPLGRMINQIVGFEGAIPILTQMPQMNQGGVTIIVP